MPKFQNVAEMDTFLEKYNLPKLNEEEAESLNRPITADKIEAIMRKTPNTQKPQSRWCHKRTLQSI